MRAPCRTGVTASSGLPRDVKSLLRVCKNNIMLWLGSKLEKTCGRRLRSEAAINGRPGLRKLVDKEGEKPGARVPEWPPAVKLGETWGPTAWKK